MLINKNTSLQKIYNISFFGLIVIPLLLIIAITMGVIGVMMRRSAVGKIENMQDTLNSALSDDIKDISLRLSHFVYVNNNSFVETAAKLDSAENSQRYELEEALDEAFKIAVMPKQDLIAGSFYMKNGNCVFLKDQILLQEDEIKQSQWYRNALEQKNQVYVGAYDAYQHNITISRLKRSELILAAALSPDISSDRSGKTEMVCLYTISKFGDILKNQYYSEHAGTTLLLNEKGEILYGTQNNTRIPGYEKDLGKLLPGVHIRRIQDQEGKKTDYTYVVSRVPDNDWKILTFVETSKLTEAFNALAIRVLLVILFLMTLFYLFSRYFLKNIILPVHTMTEGLRSLENGNLDTHIQPAGQSEIRNMMISFNKMAVQLKTSIAENEEAQKRKYEAELRALQSQMNPHFLVNALNSIRFMAQVSRFEGIRKMAEALTKIVSCSFRKNASFYTVREELEVLESYLYLMKIRYSNGFEVEYSVEEDCLDLKMPRLILQPIVENSILHGISQLDEEFGILKIQVRLRENVLVFIIEDNGKGMSEEKIREILNRKEREKNNNYSIGIENVQSRLNLYFGEASALSIESKLGEYTKITLKMPVVEESVKDV